MDATQADDDRSAQFYEKVPKQFLYTRQQAAAALAMSKARLDELIRGQEDHRGKRRRQSEIHPG
ncbi:hypothetical protein [Mycobacterium marseillense]|uniref:hypothetical protein n=1 Tax=Mycobacterium marseillense TaxID=701042 RepID=UPI00119F00E2|nr:hypothetical protein [Mycobacterium marseillense]